MDSMDEALSRLYQKTEAPESFETGWRAAVRREESMQMTKRTTWSRRLMPALAALVLVAGGLWAGTLDDELPAASAPQAMTRNAKIAGESYGYAAEDGVMLSTASTMDAGGAAPAQEEGRKIVRTADLTVNTAQFDQAYENARKMLQNAGGYVENLYQYGDAQRRVSLSMRVPSEALDAFLQSATGLGRVSNRSESTIDMTTQYVDNQARLDTLYAKRDRLNELLVKAEKVSDLIEIESAIADTQYQIDSYETSQRHIDNQVEMSAVNLTIVEEKAAETAQADVPLGERLKAAFEASVEWLGEFLRDVAVFVMMALPVVIPAAVLWIVARLIRRRGKKEV